jgi:cytochrome P450
MTALAASDPHIAGLYPRAVQAATGPLRVHEFLFQFVQNPLRIIPEAAYEQAVVARGRGQSGRKAVWITDPRLIEDFLVRHWDSLEKSEIEKRVLGRSVGDGILTSDGALWRWQRRIMAPLFRSSDIQGYVPVMAQAGQDLVDSWRAEGSGWRRIERDMTEVTFSIIARTMLAGGEPAETATIKRATERYLSHVSWEIAYTIMNVPRWVPHPASLRMHRAANQLRQSVLKLIERRRQSQARGEADGNDLLSRLLAARDPESGEPMSKIQVVNNLLTLLEAGHETTAKALSWTLYLLARAPEWQSAARSEVLSVCGRGPIGADHLPGLAITQQVLKESMRLFPPAPSMGRIVAEPLVIAGESYAPGDMVLFPIFCIHRHKRLWKDPNRFDPTRFSPEREKTYHRTQYMPFGAGPRVCIGNAFAMAEATVLLATFLRAAQFDWDGKHEPEPISRITLRPKGGMRLLVSLLES